MDYAEKYLIKSMIASSLDYPSVYMGGPSLGSIRKAEKIVDNLLYEYDITPKDKDKHQSDVELVKSWLNEDGTRKDV